MADLKAILPHVERAAILNAVIFLYFLTPSLIPFGTILIAIITLIPNSKDSLSQIFKFQKQCITFSYLKQTYQSFINLGLIERNYYYHLEILLFIFFKLIIDLIWLIPSWLTIFLAAQFFAFLGLLKDFGIQDLIDKYIKLARSSVEKAIALIPRNQPNS